MKEKEIEDYYEEVEEGREGKDEEKWVIKDIMGEMKKEGKDIEE